MTLTNRIIINLYLWIVIFSLIACTTKAIKEESVELKSNIYPKISYPKGNEYTKERYFLGEKLFFDPVLSKDSSMSCASCHKPNLYFADTISFTPGIKGRAAKRNVPSLFNVAFQPYLLREGGVPTLEMQVLVPIQEENEFNHNIVDIANQLKSDSVYNELSIKAYGREVDAYVITRSISNYERELVSFNSKYDKFLRNEVTFTLDEIAGQKLFFSDEIGCKNCHGGILFTDFSFANNGLYEQYIDKGRYRLTNDSNDIGKFKVPSLRNVAMTKPYMHDGSFKTLEAVLEHYSSGVKKHHNNKLAPLNLSEKEKKQIIAFLNTLTEEFELDE